jgi:RNA polymerase sigma-70 factor (ECF subfamily)
MAPPPTDVALARLYRDHGGDPCLSLPADAELGAVMRTLFDDGARAWPGVALPVEAFVAHLAHLAKRSGGGLPPPDRGADLYLACACARRIPGALEAFDRAHLVHMDAYLARLRPSRELVDEVRQEVRDKLYVGRGGAAPRIAEYDGRGALASWVRVVAMRAAVDVRRRGGGAPLAEEDPRAALAAEGNPERDLQRERYRKAFREAIRGAVLALERDERRILRRHFACGVTLDGLAEELGVHRATVARRLAAARTALRRDARRRLRAALGATESEIESLAAELRSQLDLSLPSLLASE